jgi:hypothetical protein
MIKEAHHKEKKYRLSEFFDQWWDDYVKNPKHFITKEQYKAVAAMRACRTEALGIDHYVCEECGEISKVYHSCKNRFCPTCSWKDTMEWAKKLEEELMDLPHRHVVFTLPHKLNELVERNKKIVLSILFKAASEALKDWMLHKYGLTPGIVSVLHTFGETKKLHPHTHMIVSWGGINKDYYPQEIKGEYVNYKFIQTKFRCKFEDMLIKEFDLGTLKHDFADRMKFMRFVKSANEKQWRIHLEPAMRIPEEIIRYIGRYSKRACISEHKITNIEGEYITFKYKDYKNLDYNGKPIVKELRLHYNDFFPRLLQHVPDAYFRLVRYYGAYSARTKGKIKESITTNKEEIKPKETEENKELVENPQFCKHCNREKKYLYTTFRNVNGETIYMSRYRMKEIERARIRQAA